MGEVEYIIQKRTMPDGTITEEKFVPATPGEYAPVMFGKWPNYQRMKLQPPAPDEAGKWIRWLKRLFCKHKPVGMYFMSQKGLCMLCSHCGGLISLQRKA